MAGQQKRRGTGRVRTVSRSTDRGRGNTGAGEGASAGSGESQPASCGTARSGDPATGDSRGRRLNYTALAGRLAGVWMVPAERLSASEQALLQEEFARLAGDPARHQALAVYTCSAGDEPELALQVRVRLSELSGAARAIVRKGLPEREPD